MRPTLVEGHSAIVPTVGGKRDSFSTTNRRSRPKAPRPTNADDTVADSIPRTDEPAAPDSQPPHMTDLEA